MKKVIIIGIIFVVILLIAVIGSILVSSNVEIKKVDDILSLQTKLDDTYSCYGYTIDNPKIVVDPYDNAPLSALIMFETKSASRVKVYVNDVFLYEEEDDTKEHYLDIYNLLINDNKVSLVLDDKKYEYDIKTDNIEIDLPTVTVDKDEILFVSIDNSLVGINSNNQVVYYLEGFTNNVIQLSNGHLLVTTNRVNNDNSYVSVTEIDMLGKIYNDYVIFDGYKSLSYQMENGNYLVLSNSVLEIDRQNGNVIHEFSFDEEDEWLSLSYENNQVVLTGKSKKIYFDYDKSTKDVVNEQNSILENKIHIRYGNYYKKAVQNRFGQSKETNTDDLDINLLFYKKVDKNYDDYQIEFNYEFDRIVVSKKKDKEIYIILDKFGERKVYNMNSNKYYINTVNLSGRYDIYVKIDDKVYKTDYYVKI